jgi:hypothetical protein
MGAYSKTMRDHRALMEELKELGATGVTLTKTTKHFRLRWTVNGKQLAYILPRTASCPHAAKNGLAQCKRLTKLALEGLTA